MTLDMSSFEAALDQLDREREQWTGSEGVTEEVRSSVGTNPGDLDGSPLLRAALGHNDEWDLANDSFKLGAAEPANIPPVWGFSNNSLCFFTVPESEEKRRCVAGGEDEEEEEEEEEEAPPLLDEIPKHRGKRHSTSASSGLGSPTVKVDPELYKVRMCRNVTASGACPYGAQCVFAHATNEVRSRDTNIDVIRRLHDTRKPMVNPLKYKIKLCEKFDEFGVCPYEPHCVFAHGEAELRTTEANQQAVARIEQICQQAETFSSSALSPRR